MSPRGFKIGLALFLVMSGLFGAKLTLLGGGDLRAAWNRAVETGSQALSRVATQAPSPETAQKPNTVAALPQPAPKASESERADASAESASHGAPLVSETDTALISAIKLELKTRGYAVGSSDSNLDLTTRAAILAFQSDNNLRLTGEASQSLLHRLLLGDAAGDADGQAPPAQRADEVIRTVQTSLKESGHPDTPVDGRLGNETADAIRAFERAHQMKVTGRISGDLVVKLQLVARDASVAGR